MKGFLKSKLATSDKNFIEIVSHSFWAFSVLGAAALIQFVFDFFLARKFGATGAGIFYICLSVVSVLSLIGHLGIDRTVVKLVPPLLLKKQFNEATGLKSLSIKVVAVNSLIITVILLATAEWISNKIFHDSEITIFLRIFSLSIVPFTLRNIYGGFLRAMKKTKEALIIERTIINSVGILAILFLAPKYGLTGVVVGFVTGCFANAIIGFRLTEKTFPRAGKPKKFSKKILFSSAIPLLFVALATQLNGQVSTLLLGSIRSSSDVGIYNVALKISVLMALILTGINSIAATTISEAHSRGNKDELEKIFGKTSAFGFVLAIPLFLIMVLFPSLLLNIFGPEFVAGSTILRILATAMLINVTVGPTLFILAMTGYEKALAFTIVSSLVLNIVIGLALIPSFGYLGAAIATSFALIFSNFVMLLLVRKYLGIWSLPFKYLSLWVRHSQ